MLSIFSVMSKSFAWSDKNSHLQTKLTNCYANLHFWYTTNLGNSSYEVYSSFFIKHSLDLLRYASLIFFIRTLLPLNKNTNNTILSKHRVLFPFLFFL